MNERIRELHQQAKDFINEVSDNDGTYQGKEYPEAVREKFAELIVQECADFVSSKADLQSGLGIKTMLKVTGEQLKEHFGVE